jgi:HSP20 family molecular chaperone IbpA
MYEDPQDMFPEMDELFAHLYARMTRDFTAGEPQAFGYHVIIQQDGETPAMPISPRDHLRANSEPIVEIHRIGDEVKVITELPGTTMDAIELSLLGSTLTIDADGGSLQYHTHADLPPVDSGSMQTSFKNGVLEITLQILPHVADKEAHETD